MSAASMVVAVEACIRHSPDVMIDTVGHAFVYPVFRFLTQCRIGCYVHYPTISSDMVRSIERHDLAVNNSDFIARSDILSQAKLIYYQMFSMAYRSCGFFCQLVMANSSWTKGHIDRTWNISSVLVYPPCDVEKIVHQKRGEFEGFSVVSVAQFRPEKRLEFQLEILKLLKEREPERLISTQFKWRFVGSCRNNADTNRANKLMRLAEYYNLSEYIKLDMNLSYEELMNVLSTGTVAVHTMVEEHFGIAVVECMAAGLITIAHGTGGPKMDILRDPDCGFTAISAEEYVDALTTVMRMPEEKRDHIRKNAQAYVMRFDTSKFMDLFLKASRPLFRSV